MGDRGPAATTIPSRHRPGEFSRWEIGDQPQLVRVLMSTETKFSRWEIGDQPQPEERREPGRQSLADGRSGTSRNGAEDIGRINIASVSQFSFFCFRSDHANT